jgi:hypothetical protein
MEWVGVRGGSYRYRYGEPVAMVAKVCKEPPESLDREPGFRTRLPVRQPR